jgi:hypothetical protein
MFDCLKVLEYLWKNDIFNFCIDHFNIMLKDGEVKFADIFMARSALNKTHDGWKKDRGKIN